MDVLQKELHRVATEWNIHHIASKMNHEGPAGKPDVMYYTPTLYDIRDYGFPVNRDDVSICKDIYSKEKPNDYTPEFAQLLGLLIPDLPQVMLLTYILVSLMTLMNIQTN